MNRQVIRLEKYTAAVKPSLNLTVTSATTFGRSPGVGVYEMQSECRGVLFYANIIEFHDGDDRGGAEKDRENFISLFRQMGFDIFYFENITAKVSISLC